MNNSLQNCFKHFYGNAGYHSTPLEKMQLLAQSYPYFPVAQFFLAKKMKDENDENFSIQAQKTVLYFSNPLQFDALLHTRMPIVYKDDHYIEDLLSNTETTNNINTKESVEIISPDESRAPFLPTEPEDEPDEHEKMFRSIKAMLDATTAEADANITETDITIDPFYTVDYFASQGIKLDIDLHPQDKLGQNLKKFTHWLKHMKKLGPEDANVELENPAAEADVQKLADSSNNTREIVTEAMATVLVKQGKKTKAIELYNKLSFLNPEKRPYFAAQIEKLNDL